mmetsp:Transcript_2410/g.4477  ORF Transcript_2410/g.4477 Transcript_2410/m.4477 type:complete len:83 (-) Transcript_2410:156-404(-)
MMNYHQGLCPGVKGLLPFAIQHLASLLFLGIFDDDNIDDHTPIGHVVLDWSSLKCNTTYLLQYKLYSNPKMKDNRGEVTICL